MDKRDFYKAKDRFQLAVKHTAASREPVLMINITTGEQFLRGDPNRVSEFYARVVAELDALTAAMETWE